MTRKFIPIFMLLLLCASNAAAEAAKSPVYSREEGTVVAAVEIKEKGVYNLVVTLEFMRRPYDGSLYTSAEYKRLIERLMTEAKGVLLQRILERRYFAISELADIKKDIEIFIGNLIAQLKKEYVPGQDVDVIFSITDFYLLAPLDN